MASLVLTIRTNMHDCALLSFGQLQLLHSVQNFHKTWMYAPLLHDAIKLWTRDRWSCSVGRMRRQTLKQQRLVPTSAARADFRVCFPPLRLTNALKYLLLICRLCAWTLWSHYHMVMHSTIARNLASMLRCLWTYLHMCTGQYRYTGQLDKMEVGPRSTRRTCRQLASCNSLSLGSELLAASWRPEIWWVSSRSSPSWLIVHCQGALGPMGHASWSCSNADQR